MNGLIFPVLEVLKKPSNIEACTKGLVYCKLLIKNSPLDVDIRKLSIQETVEIACMLKEPMAYVFHSLFTMVGLFGFDIDYKKSIEFAEKIINENCEDYLDVAHMVLMFHYKAGTVFDASDAKAKVHLDMIKDKDALLHSLFSLNV